MAYDILWKVHGILMATSFLAMSTGITISLLRKGKKGTFQIHRGLGIYAAGAGLTALLTAFVMVQIAGGYHFSGFHGSLGLAIGLLLIATPLLMLLKKTKTKKPFRRAHKILGFATLLLMAVNIYTGLYMMGII